MGAAGALSIVHIENAYASGHKKRPRGPRSTQRAKPCIDLCKIPQRPHIDLKSAAVFYYLYYHVQPRDSMKRSIFDWIRPTWESKPDSALLDLAVRSMALAVFSRQHPPAAIEASMTYHQLLKTVGSTIAFLTRDNLDTCLLSIFLMSRFENAVHNRKSEQLRSNRPFATTVTSFSHHDGALAVLKIWKDCLSRTKAPSEIIKYTRRGLIRSALIRKLAIAEWMQDGVSFGEEGLDLEYDRIVIRLANLRQRLFALLQKRSNVRYQSSSLIDALAKEAQHVDAALDKWITHFPETWHRQRHTFPASCLCSMEGCYSSTLYSYINSSVALFWNNYYATRMVANSTLLRLLELAGPSLAPAEKQRVECQRRINTMADDIAAGLPFYLRRFEVKVTLSDSDQESMVVKTNQDIKPYMAGQIAWPLGIAASLVDVDMKQRSWFRTELVHLGRMKGDRVIEDGNPCNGLNF